MKISCEDFIAGERYLHDRCEEFDNGTRGEAQSQFIPDLLREVFPVSRIVLEMPPRPPSEPESNSLEVIQDMPQLLAYVTELDGVDFGLSVSSRLG